MPPLNIACAALVAMLSVAAAAPAPQIDIFTATGTAAVAAAAATAKTLSPTSHVPGKAFDRFVTIWLENTAFDEAAADRKCYPWCYPGRISRYLTSVCSEFEGACRPRHKTHQLLWCHSPQ